MNDPMAELTTRFISEALERTTAIEALVAELPDASDQAVPLDAIRDHAHKIKGAAGMFGFDQLKVIAESLELAAAGGATEEVRSWAARLRRELPTD